MKSKRTKRKRKREKKRHSRRFICLIQGCKIYIEFLFLISVQISKFKFFCESCSPTPASFYLPASLPPSVSLFRSVSLSPSVFLSPSVSLPPSVSPFPSVSLSLSIDPLSFPLNLLPLLFLDVYHFLLSFWRLSQHFFYSVCRSDHCLSVYLSVCLSVSLSICLSVSLSVYLSVCLSVRFLHLTRVHSILHSEHHYFMSSSFQPFKQGPSQSGPFSPIWSITSAYDVRINKFSQFQKHEYVGTNRSKNRNENKNDSRVENRNENGCERYREETDCHEKKGKYQLYGIHM